LQKTMLKNVDWGGLTIVNLLGVLAFPPYFIYLMTLAALTASGFLWTTHLSEADQLRFLEFEKEFRKGYKLEKAGKLKEAQKWYGKLKKRYANHPQANHLVTLQIEKLSANTGKFQKNSRLKKGLSPQTNRARS
jgi:hypothetical protein